MTKRQESHRREKDRIKARLLAEPDSEWSIQYRKKRRETQARWHENNPQAKKKHDKSYYDKNREQLVKCGVARKRKKKTEAGWCPLVKRTPEQISERKRQWQIKHRVRLNALAVSRRAASPNVRIKCNLRKRLSWLVRKSSTSKTAQTMELLGCSVPSFMLYMESLFEIGMNWQNYGKWHIDHIMPCAIFDLSKPDHQKRCFHFSNMQPLWATANKRNERR